LQEHFKTSPESVWKRLPLHYFLAFIAYSLILFVEKVAFDSHSLTDHQHHPEGSPNEPLLQDNKEKNDVDGIAKDNVSHDIIIQTNEIPENKRHTHRVKRQYSGMDLLLKTPSPKLTPSRSRKTKTEYNPEVVEAYSDHSDIDEETVKMIVSSKGKFASYMQNRNICKKLHLILVIKPEGKVDKALITAARILHKTRKCNSLEEKCMNEYYPIVKSDLKTEEETRRRDIEPSLHDKVEDVEHHHHFNPKSNITPYVLLVALSVHGLFEGIALGLQAYLKETLFLAAALLSHKWAESFTLGVSFFKSNTDNTSIIKMICLFAAFTPVGIIIGMLLAGKNSLIVGIFLSLASGTFLYISASEVIVEEFSITRYKYQKYALYLLGGLFVGLLAYLEVLNE
jgi:zinc transporter ZupT